MMERSIQHIQALPIDYALLPSRIFKVLASALVLFAAVYAFSLGRIVFSLVAERTTETAAHELSASIASLEVEYLDLSAGITPEKGKTLGLSEAAHVIFAGVASGSTLTLNVPSHAF